MFRHAYQCHLLLHALQTSSATTRSKRSFHVFCQPLQRVGEFRTMCRNRINSLACYVTPPCTTGHHTWTYAWTDPYVLATMMVVHMVHMVHMGKWGCISFSRPD